MCKQRISGEKVSFYYWIVDVEEIELEWIEIRFVAEDRNIYEIQFTINA